MRRPGRTPHRRRKRFRTSRRRRWRRSTITRTAGDHQTREGAKVEEFRVNGKLYKIRVTPDNGVPYYLIDQRGDGTFTRMDTPGTPQLSVPMWVIGTF